MAVPLRISQRQLLLLKILIHLACLVPLVVMFYWGFDNQLGADPVEELLHFTGISAFNVLLLSLCISPLSRYLKASALIKVRRLLGLYAFTYALAHLLTYLFFELQFDWSLLINEIIKRPYITVGFVALCILTSLAVTSTRWAQRKMGKAWQKLHNWVYLAAILIALHYIWSVKSAIGQPIIYWLILLSLLFLRRQKLITKFKK